MFPQLDVKRTAKTDKIEKLRDGAVDSGEIRRILGKSTNCVTAALSRRKNRKNREDP